jgi:two-component sensor histidine kinase
VELYLSPLIDRILSTFQDVHKVSVEKRFDEFDLDARTLFSLGLIVNELLTNAMKHAFVGRDRGTISVAAVLEGEEVRVDISTTESESRRRRTPKPLLGSDSGWCAS